VDRQAESFPKLYGAPGNFRPPKGVEDTERTPDVDDQPLEFDRRRGDRARDELTPRPYRHGTRPTAPTVVVDDEGELQPAGVSLRGLAERLLGERGSRAIPEFRRPGSRGVGSGPAGE
jgi:hypothetical protein